MAEQRLIDANKEVIRAYEDIPEPYSDVLIDFLRGCKTIDLESLPIVQQLREALSKAVAEKEAAEALLAEYSGVDGCKTIKTCFGYPLDEVQRLVQADREGRCVVFKFSLGQTVYRSWVRPDGTHPFVSGHTMQTVDDLVNAEAWDNAHKTEQEALVELFTRKGDVD